MNKGYMKEVANLLGLELGEEFRIKGEDSCFKFNHMCLLQYYSNDDRWMGVHSDMLESLLLGNREIEKTDKTTQKSYGKTDKKEDK